MKLEVAFWNGKAPIFKKVPNTSNADALGRLPTRPTIPKHQYHWRVRNETQKSTFLQIGPVISQQM